ncbi:hypothetical protein E4T56_gene9840 [Termitomyces sp. T112]|nr:hypothetical protein E4T56_gene9840 [Termitomyces sp. T112]
MSLSLKFSSDILSRFLEAIASNQVTFQQSSSVKIMPPGIVAIVDVTEVLYDSFRNGEFHYRGRISLPNEPSPCEVVVKILFGHKQILYSQRLEDYIQEAKIYQDRLCCNKSLYGSGVPKLYGFYESKLTWKTAKRDIVVDGACMVYQFYGSDQDVAWSTGSGISDFSSQVFKLLLEVHKGGVRHNSIGLDRNITCLDGRPFLTDFSQAYKHDCPDKEFELPTHLLDVDADTLKCGELRDFYTDLQHHVAPAKFHWYGYDVYYNRMDSLRSIFEHRRRMDFDEDIPVEEQWEYAVKVWKFLCANWSSYHKTRKAPSLGDISFEAYKAKYGLNITHGE